MSHAIVTRALAKRFGGATALHALDWSVPRGSVTALVGPNGAGKTTTTKLLLGLTRPAAGSAEVLGLDPWRSTLALRRRVGFVPEDKTGFDALRVGELARAVAPLFPTWDAARLDRALARWRIEPRARMTTLSKGQRSKVLLALATAHAPELLLLDEPTDGLDPASQDLLLRDLVDAAADGTTVVVVTHRLGEIEGVADRLALLDGGRLVLEGDTEALRDTWRLVRARVDRPLADVGALPGARRVERSGAVTTVLSDRADELARTLAAAGADGISVDRVSLRELYIAATAGEAP